MAQENDASDRVAKVKKALRAMESIGIPPKTVLPVLKRLWKVYGRENWELIEENNYSTLADAVFEYENEKKSDANGSELNGGPDSQLHKQEGAQMEAQASSIMASGSRTLPCSTSQPSNLENLLTVGEAKHTSREGKVIVQGHHHQDGNVTQNNVREIQLGTPSNEYTDKDKRVNGVASQFGASSNTTLDIASSTCGNVKISLTLLNEASGQMPKLEAVMKHVEDNYLRSFNIVGQDFSLPQFLKQFCDSYAELGSSSAAKTAIDETSGNCNQDRAERDARQLGMNKRIKRGSASSASTSLVATKQQSISSEQRKFFRRIDDISNGAEKVSISLVDEFGKEEVPKFVYIPQSTVYQCAYVQGSMARISDEDCCSKCSGDCLSSCPCECTRQTGGEYAYTSEGLLRDEFLNACISMSDDPQRHHHFYCTDCPLERAKNASIQGKCNGHLIRKFVKECWRKCGCNIQQCGNRVVQRGITRKLQIFMTAEGKGWGVRTLEELPKGAFIFEYVGEILTNMELFERNKESNKKARHTYSILLDADWGVEGVLKDEDALCLDATHYGNVARFVNHRCFDANLIDIPVEVESPDHHYYHLAFFTKRKVDAFEELTWDYKIDFEDRDHPIKAFKCCCGSPDCRG